MRQHPELYLRIVGREQRKSGGRHEGAANPPALFAAGGDVLKIRVARAESAGGGQRLMKRSVDTSRGWVDQLRQRVAVGGFQLGDRPIFEQLAWHWMSAGELLQRIGIGRVSAIAFFEALYR